MVQMKVTASILLAAAVIAPVVAYGFEAEDSLATRENNEFEGAFARDFDLELEERELDDNLLEREFNEELVERARGGGGGRSFSGGRIMKFGGGRGIRKGLGRVASAASETLSETREINDDILEREDEDELMVRSIWDQLLGGSRPSTHGGKDSHHHGSVSGTHGKVPGKHPEFRQRSEELEEREIDGDELFGRDVDLEA